MSQMRSRWVPLLSRTRRRPIPTGVRVSTCSPPGGDATSAGGITSDWDTGNDATAVLSGTSMATPHVVGVVAQYLGRNPSATPAQVASALLGGATTGHVTGLGTGSPDRLVSDAFLPNFAPGAPLLGAMGVRGKVSLTWAAPALDGGSPVTAYKVYRGASIGAEDPDTNCDSGGIADVIRRHDGDRRHPVLVPGRRGELGWRNPVERSVGCSARSRRADRARRHRDQRELGRAARLAAARRRWLGAHRVHRLTRHDPRG